MIAPEEVEFSSNPKMCVDGSFSFDLHSAVIEFMTGFYGGVQRRTLVVPLFPAKMVAILAPRNLGNSASSLAKFRQKSLII